MLCASFKHTITYNPPGLDVAAITKTVVENIRTGSDEAMRDLLPSDTLEAVTTEVITLSIKIGNFPFDFLYFLSV